MRCTRTSIHPEGAGGGRGRGRTSASRDRTALQPAAAALDRRRVAIARRVRLGLAEQGGQRGGRESSEGRGGRRTASQGLLGGLGTGQTPPQGAAPCLKRARRHAAEHASIPAIGHPRSTVRLLVPTARFELVDTRYGCRPPHLVS